MRERVRTSHEWHGWQGLKMASVPNGRDSEKVRASHQCAGWQGLQMREGEGQSQVCQVAGTQNARVCQVHVAGSQNARG